MGLLNVGTFKAQLVVEGFTQNVGINYRGTYSLVAKFAFIRSILLIVAYLDLKTCPNRCQDPVPQRRVEESDKYIF